MSSTSEPQSEDGLPQGESDDSRPPGNTRGDSSPHGLSGAGAASVIPHLERLKKAQVRPPEPPAAPKKGDGAAKKGKGPADESGGQAGDDV